MAISSAHGLPTTLHMTGQAALSPLYALLTGPCWGPAAAARRRRGWLPSAGLHAARLSLLVPKTVYASYACSYN